MIINNKQYYTLHQLAGSGKLKLRPTFWGNYFAIKQEVEKGNLECQSVNIGSVRYLISEEAVEEYLTNVQPPVNL